MLLALPTFSKWRLAGLIAVLSFGATALIALGASLLVGSGIMPGPIIMLTPIIFVVGFFILLPLVFLLGEDFPLVESEDDTAEEMNPVATLRQQYAEGDINDDEFERRLDRLLETEKFEDYISAQKEAGDELERELNR